MELTRTVHKETFRFNRNVVYIDFGDDYTNRFVKIHEAVNVRFMHVLACKLHLDKELLAYKIAGHTQPGDSVAINGL